jgi:hypothetical protein
MLVSIIGVAIYADFRQGTWYICVVTRPHGLRLSADRAVSVETEFRSDMNSYTYCK